MPEKIIVSPFVAAEFAWLKHGVDWTPEVAAALRAAVNAALKAARACK